MADNKNRTFNDKVKQTQPTEANDQLGENRAPEYEGKDLGNNQNTKNRK